MDKPSFKHERLLWKKGLNYIAGVDEVGRGAFAGPVVAAVVILSKNFKLKGIRDSKALTSEQREKFSKYIKTNAISYCISKENVGYINKYGVGQATQKAFLKGLQSINH